MWELREGGRLQRMLKNKSRFEREPGYCDIFTIVTFFYQAR